MRGKEMAEYTIQPEEAKTEAEIKVSGGNVDLEPSRPPENGGRLPNGQFTKGNRGGPGRPKLKDEEALIRTLSERFPPNFIADKLQAALDLAETQKSSRGIVACLTFIENYRTGTPIKRVIKETTGYDKLRALLDKAESEED